MRSTVMLAALVASAIALAGCGGDEGSGAADTMPAETVETAPPTTPAETTPTTPAATVIPIRVVGGVPQGGIQRPTIEQGEKVVLVIRSDSGESVHLHGYNIEQSIVPGRPTRVPFTADIAGRFELELHPTDTVLAVLEVQP